MKLKEFQKSIMSLIHNKFLKDFTGYVKLKIVPKIPDSEILDRFC